MIYNLLAHPFPDIHQTGPHTPKVYNPFPRVPGCLHHLLPFHYELDEVSAFATMPLAY